MAGTVIVGYEGSERSRDALAFAEVLAASQDAQLVVACVHPPTPRTAAIGAAGFDREVRAGAQRTAESARNLLAQPEEAEFDTVLGTSAADGLAEFATERGATAIVLGSSRRGALGRVVPGSTAARLTAGAPCAIAVAPVGYAERAWRPLSLIGVAYDGSPESTEALHLGERLAARQGGRLRIIAVAESRDERVARSSVLEQAAVAAPVSVAAETVLREGKPAEQLSLAGADLDLLVCGSRGRGRLRQVVLGSVSGQLIENARCPLLITPPARA
jgi:nucleotide-binding universal stress UspA family protein